MMKQDSLCLFFLYFFLKDPMAQEISIRADCYFRFVLLCLLSDLLFIR